MGTKHLFLVALAAAASLTGGVPARAAAEQAPAPLVTVDHVDLQKYLGRWYEIAKIPNASRSS